MKKAFLLPLLLSSILLPSCDNAPANMEEVNKLKDLISKQDLSPAYDKMFTCYFSQDYDVFSSCNGNEEEAETQFYSYRGAGVFGCLYEVSVEAYAEVEALENHDFFDYLARGIGDYGLVQNATLVSYLYESGENETIKSLQSLNYLQSLDVRFTDDNVQVTNSLFVKDAVEGGFNIDSEQSFNGAIDKETLFDTITVRAFSDIFARTNLFDGQHSAETLNRIYSDIVEELSDKTDAELSAFVDKNHIRIEDEEENTLVHFAVEDEDLRAVLDENDIVPGIFEGTLTYEKESGKFTNYEYSITYVSNDSDEDAGNVYGASMVFKASGYSLNQKYDGELYVDDNAVVYDDAEAFLDDVVKEVIPPAI